jgi:ketosteroid isomerase-like protein
VLFFRYSGSPPRPGAAISKDDQYAISVAKTAYRDAYNNADLDLLLGVFASQFTDCSDGEPSFYGEEAVQALRIRTRKLFQDFEVRMRVLIIEIVVMGDFAYDWGWHKLRLTEKSTGQVNETRYRYFERWKKENGSWKIDYIITNRELPPRMLPEPAGEDR